MQDRDSVADGPLSACGHANPPGSRFCDVCGVKLPAPCARCQAVNRIEANFCSTCGLELREASRAAAAAPLPDAVDALVWTEGDAGDAGDAVLEYEPENDRTRLARIQRFVERRERARRARAWAGILGAGVVVGLLGAAVVRTYVATPIRGEERSAVVAPPGGPAARLPEPGRTSRAAPSPVADPPARLVAVAESRSSGAPPPDAPVRSDQGGRPPAAGENGPAVAPGSPRAGGELTFVVPGEPPSYDAHREETFALIHPAAPHYNTLLRIDPFDPTGTRVVGDLVTSWTVSPDKRTYVLKLRRGVKFHDGTELTSRDVRATYQKIINPPSGITSARKGEYLEIETVQAPEPYIVAFKLRWPSPSFIHSLASPWNWIYKADILERDVRWYERNIMGTGPFTFVEHVKGSHWVGRRNPHYWDRGKPYLDGYRALFIRDDAAQAQAISTGRAHIQFRGFSPAHRDDIVRALGDRVTVQESPWNCGLLVAINHAREPFHDRRVRRALSLALDRYGAAEKLSRVAIVREVAGVQVPRTPFATPPAELVKLAGYGRDIGEARTQARRLLAEAEVAPGSAFVLKNRNIPMPYTHVGTWLVEQWREIGLDVRHEIQDSAEYFKALRAGDFELSTDFQCGYVVNPDLDLYKFQSRDRSDANYGRYTDPVLDDLYVRQSRTVDPERRRRYIREFERRLLEEEAHYIYTLQWHRIVPHSARVHGWTITPSHYLNNQLDTVWLAE
jgi:peptide/nickel transport system substrate-binding protein